MLNTTFALCHQHAACISSYRRLAEELGGISNYGKNTPIPLSRIVEILGLDDALWAMRCTIEPSDNILIEFTYRCGQHMLHSQAIAAARICLTDKSDAALDAAWTARDAERVWQTQTFLELLNNAVLEAKR